MDTHGQKKIQTMAQRKRDYRRENYNGGHATLAKLYGLTGSIEYYIIFFFALFFYLFFATSTARVLNVNRNHRKFQYQLKKQTQIWFDALVIGRSISSTFFFVAHLFWFWLWKVKQKPERTFMRSSIKPSTLTLFLHLFTF